MKNLFLRLTSVALVLLLLFVAGGCRSGPIETPDDVKQEMIAMAKESLQEISFENLTVQDFYEYTKAHDFFVMNGNEFVSGQEIWENFLNKSKNGETCTVKYIRFSDYYFKNKKLPDIYILHFDGEYYREISYLINQPEEITVCTWKFLLTFGDEDQDALGNMCVLVNDSNITDQHIREYLDRFASSNKKDHPKTELAFSLVYY